MKTETKRLRTAEKRHQQGTGGGPPKKFDSDIADMVEAIAPYMFVEVRLSQTSETTMYKLHNTLAHFVAGRRKYDFQLQLQPSGIVFHSISDRHR